MINNSTLSLPDLSKKKMRNRVGGQEGLVQGINWRHERRVLGCESGEGVKHTTRSMVIGRVAWGRCQMAVRGWRRGVGG